MLRIDAAAGLTMGVVFVLLLCYQKQCFVPVIDLNVYPVEDRFMRAWSSWMLSVGSFFLYVSRSSRLSASKVRPHANGWRIFTAWSLNPRMYRLAERASTGLNLPTAEELIGVPAMSPGLLRFSLPQHNTKTWSPQFL